MTIEMQFNSIAQLQRLQEIASSCSDEIHLHSLDDSVQVDAKSFIGLFTLDFDRPVKVDDHLMDAMRYFIRTFRVYRVEEKYSSPFADQSARRRDR